MKAKQCFSIYNENEELVFVANDYDELAKWFNKSKRVIQTNICKLSKGKIETIKPKYDKRKYKVYKVDIDEEDI